MGRNLIFYGPPGTGKTFEMQKMAQNYLDLRITDDEIINAYIETSYDWVLLALILLQRNNLLTSDEIASRINELRVTGFNKSPSAVLGNHSVSINPLFSAVEPQIFRERDGKWSVEIDRLLEYDREFFQRHLSNEAVQKRYEFCTFHQSFVYEDFVEGIRPVVLNDQDEIGSDDEQGNTIAAGNIAYRVQEGIFKRICRLASQNPQKNYAIFIDEINRGNVSEIFGELISLIEPDKRLGAPNELTVKLPYSKKDFGVPNNLDIIGTMNSADRSVTVMDIALRRRFEFINLTYNPEVIRESLQKNGVDPENIEGINLISMLDTINERIELLLDANFVIGHAYFTKVRTFEDIKAVLLNKVIPLLEEYFYDDLQKIQLVFADLDETGSLKDNAIYKHKNLETTDLLEYVGDYIIESKKRFFVNRDLDKSSLQKIYTKEV
jgi:adenylate kinase family enzyme